MSGPRSSFKKSDNHGFRASIPIFKTPLKSLKARVGEVVGNSRRTCMTVRELKRWRVPVFVGSPWVAYKLAELGFLPDRIVMLEWFKEILEESRDEI